MGNLGNEKINLAYVDDEEHLLIIIKELLENFVDEDKLNLKLYDSGLKCLEDFSKMEAPADFTVVTDINMPSMTGIELMEKLKAMNSGIPVYICSAFDHHNYKKQAKSLGAEGFFTKPIDVSELLGQIFPALA